MLEAVRAEQSGAEYWCCAETRRGTAPPMKTTLGDRSWGQNPGSSRQLGAIQGPVQTEPRRPTDPGKTRREARLLRPAAEPLSLHGKEGVDGSSPSEGSWERPAHAGLSFSSGSTRSCRWVPGGYGSFSDSAQNEPF